MLDGLVTAAGGGGVTLLGVLALQWLRTRSAEKTAAAAEKTADANVEIAKTIHDERIAPDLLDRINTLENRCEERDAQIDQLQDHVRQCEESNKDNARAAEECEQRYRALELRLAKVERRTTPPDFPAVKETERTDG